MIHRLVVALCVVVASGTGCGEGALEVGQHSAAVLSAPDVLYEDLFESCDGGSTASGTGSTWQCGEPVSDPTGDADGSGLLWATALDGPYQLHEESALTSPVIPLPRQDEGTGELRLSMAVWYDFAHNPSEDFGGARVEAFDGLGWRVLEPHGGWDGVFRAPGTPLDGALGLTDSGTIRTWRRLVFEVTTLAGPDFRFRVVVANRHPHRGSGIAVDTVRVERIATASDRADAALDQIRAVHGARIDAALAVLPSEERTKRLDRLFWRGIFPGELSVRRNAFGAIGSLTGLFLRAPHSTGPARATPLDAADAFQAEFGRDLVGAEPDDELVADPRSPALAFGLPGAVIYQQRFRGMRVLAARAEVFLDRELRVYRAFGSVVPGFSVDPHADLDERRASALAVAAAEDETHATCAAADGPELAGWNEALDGGADIDHLAFRVEIGCGQTFERVVLVDAHDGTILRLHDPVKLYGEPGFATDRFSRFADDTEECFGPRAQCGAEEVWRDGECLWHYNVENLEVLAGGQAADEDHPANCVLVPETDQIIRAFDGAGEYVRSQPWQGREWDVEDVIACEQDGLEIPGFCVSFDESDAVFGDNATIAYESGLTRVLHLRPAVGGPDAIAHESSHAILDTLRVAVTGSVDEHIADATGAIGTRRALDHGFGFVYEAPDPWIDAGTAESAGVLTKSVVRGPERPCSVLDVAPRDRPVDWPERLLFDPDLPAAAARWRSLREPWAVNRGHCEGAGSLNEEWQSAAEAYAQYYSPGTNDTPTNPEDTNQILTHSQVLSHTNLGIGNRMLTLFTEGGRSRGIVVDGQGFHPVFEAGELVEDGSLEETLFGAVVAALPHAGEDGAGHSAHWAEYAGSLAQAACDLDAERGDGPGCDLDLNDRADAVVHAAAAVSLWSEPHELHGTEAAVGDRPSAVSWVAPGADERVYVFYRGSDAPDEQGNAPIHYRWLDVSPDRYFGESLADGAWHPRDGDCVIPDAASREGPSAIARSTGVFVSWVQGTAEGGRVLARSFGDLPEDRDDCVADDAWSQLVTPAVQDEEVFPAFAVGGALRVDGPVTVVEVPLETPGSPEMTGATCVNMEAPANPAAFPLAPVALRDPDAWRCLLFPGERPFIQEWWDDFARMFDEAIDPAEIRAQVVYGVDPFALRREDFAIGTELLVDPAPFAAVDTTLRAALQSSTLPLPYTPPSDLPPGEVPLGGTFGNLFDLAFDPENAARGVTERGVFRISQELLPETDEGKPRQALTKELGLFFPTTALFLVWRDPDGQVYVHPWEPFFERIDASEEECIARGGVFHDGDCLTPLEPAPVFRSSVAPAAVAHHYRADGFDERDGIYVFGADEDGAVIVAHSTNEDATAEGLMVFGSEQILPLMEGEPGPRPPLYRAWTDRPVAVWSRPARGRGDRGTIHVVIFPLWFDPLAQPADPFLSIEDARLGFRFQRIDHFPRSSDPRPLLSSVLDVSRTSGDVEIRHRERLFALEGTDARDDRFDDLRVDRRFPEPEYRPATGAGVVTQRDVVLYLEAAQFDWDDDTMAQDLSVRAKVGQ